MPPPLPAQQLNFRQRLGAMRNIPPFLRGIGETSRPLTLATIGLRLVRAIQPLETLDVGKLIIDEAVRRALGVRRPRTCWWPLSGFLRC